MSGIGKKIEEHEYLQELTEKVLSYFWDRLVDGGAEEWPEIEYLIEEMEYSEEDLVRMFAMLGFDEE